MTRSTTGLEICADQMKGIRAVFKVTRINLAIIYGVVDHPPQKGDIGSGAHRGVDVCLGRSSSETGINADDRCVSLDLCFHNPLEGDRVVLRRIAAHNENDIGVLDVYPVVRHHPSTKRLSQSRHGGGVSETGLMFKIDNAKPPHQFANQVTGLIVEGCSA